MWGSDVVNDFDKKLLITEYLKETQITLDVDEEMVP